MTDHNRNPNLLYSFDEKPKPIAMLLFAIQYLVPNIVSLLLLVLVLNQGNVDADTATSILSIGMIVMAGVTLAQCIKRFGIGPGMLLPPSIAPPYLAPSIIALKTGGLSLLFGMTLIAGIVQAGLSFVIKHLRKVIPPEVAALVLLLIGIELGGFSLSLYSQIKIPSQLNHPSLFYFVMALPVLLILLFDQMCNNFCKRYAIALAVISSYVIIFLSGYFPADDLTKIKQASWFHLPHFIVGHYHFSTELLAPFVIAAIICGIKMIGSVSALQNIQLKEPPPTINFKQQAKANFNDSLGTITSGLLGALGMNASSSGIALSLSLGVTSRFIAIPIAGILLVLAFIPKISFILLFIPKAIMAAVLIDLGAALVRSSSLILIKSLHQLKTQLIIGIGLSAGLSYGVFPGIFKQLPSSVHLFIGSSIALAMFAAILLHWLLGLIRVKES